MTWIVAAPTLRGYAVAASDIRVTFRDGSECDCLQKIYPVGPNIALGFSGSVAVGFDMLDKARRLLRDPTRPRQKHPECFAADWPRFARRVFEDADECERAVRCDLVILGAFRKRGIVQTCAFGFRDPVFKPSRVQFGGIRSIGSGARRFGDRLRPIWERKVLPLHLTPYGRGILGRELVNRLSALLAVPIPHGGVSRHLQFTTVSINGVRTEDVLPFLGPARSQYSLCNFSYLEPDDRTPIHQLAKTKSDFDNIAKKRGFPSAVARA